jgi:hypothetical protein
LLKSPVQWSSALIIFLCLSRIDYYGVTFDHLVPADDPNPEVLAINIIEVDSGGGVYADGGIFANKVLSFPVHPREYTGKKVLAVPRCCQYKKGTQDRERINSEVAERDNKDNVYRNVPQMQRWNWL